MIKTTPAAGTSHPPEKSHANKIVHLDRPPSQPQEVVFIRDAPGLGDLVSCLGAIQGYRLAHRAARILVVAPDPILTALEHHPDVDELVSRREDAPPGCHAILLSNPCPASHYEAAADQIRQSRVELFAAAAGVQPEIPQLYITQREADGGEQWVAEHGGWPCVALVLRTSSRWRDYEHPRGLAELLRDTHGRNVVTIDHEQSLPTFPATQGLTIRQQMAILHHADLVVTPDTGWLHVAGALGVPTFGIFGSMDPDFRMVYDVPSMVYVGECPLRRQYCNYAVCCPKEQIQPCLSEQPSRMAASIDRMLASLLRKPREAAIRLESAPGSPGIFVEPISVPRETVYVQAGGGIGDISTTMFGIGCVNPTWLQLNDYRNEYPNARVIAVLTSHASNTQELLALDERIDAVLTYPWYPPGHPDERSWQTLTEAVPLECEGEFRAEDYEIRLSQMEQEVADQVLELEPIVVHPFAGLDARSCRSRHGAASWPEHRWAELINLITKSGRAVIVLGHTEWGLNGPRAFRQDSIEGLDYDEPSLFNFVNLISLRLATYLSRHCAGFIGQHSSMLAAAWTNAVPNVFFYPTIWGEGDEKSLAKDGGTTGTWAINEPWVRFFEGAPDALAAVTPEEAIDQLRAAIRS